MAGSMDGAGVSLTDFGPPDKMMPEGRRAANSAALVVCGTISE